MAKLLQQLLLYIDWELIRVCVSVDATERITKDGRREIEERIALWYFVFFLALSNDVVFVDCRRLFDADQSILVLRVILAGCVDS